RPSPGTGVPLSGTSSNIGAKAAGSKASRPSASISGGATSSERELSASSSSGLSAISMMPWTSTPRRASHAAASPPRDSAASGSSASGSAASTGESSGKPGDAHAPKRSLRSSSPGSRPVRSSAAARSSSTVRRSSRAAHSSKVVPDSGAGFEEAPPPSLPASSGAGSVSPTGASSPPGSREHAPAVVATPRAPRPVSAVRRVVVRAVVPVLIPGSPLLGPATEFSCICSEQHDARRTAAGAPRGAPAAVWGPGGSARGAALDVVRVDGLRAPGEHLAQVLADLLDRVLGLLGAELLELLGAVVLVVDEALGEGAGLDVGEDRLHVGLRLVGDHAGAGDVVAVLGGVGDRPALLGDAALVHEVDDELELVEHLEVGDLRLVAGVGEGLEAGLDEVAHAAAQHGLLT